MFKLIVLSMIIAYASAGLIGAPLAVAHAPVVAVKAGATSYQNSNSWSVHPVPVAVQHAPIAVAHAAPIAVAAPAIAIGHGGYSLGHGGLALGHGGLALGHGGYGYH